MYSIFTFFRGKNKDYKDKLLHFFPFYSTRSVPIPDKHYKKY